MIKNLKQNIMKKNQIKKSILFNSLIGTLTILSMSKSSFVRAQTKVLFLGNSFTYTYDIPTLFENMASNTGQSVFVDQYTQPGIAVYDDQVTGHINDPAAQSKITSQQWDFIVVQDNMGGWVYDFIAGTPGNANVTLYNQIKANNPCTRVVYFAAWGPEGGVPSLGYPNESTVNCNNRIHTNWVNFNDQATNEIVSPIGKVWNQSLSSLPSVDLYYSDNVHPSLEGSYLAALTIYTSIFKKDPNDITYTGGVSTSTANTMKSIAWNIVMDPTMFTQCNLDEYTPVISQNGDDLSTTGFNSYQWYFNGNPIAGATSATYTVTQIGTYSVEGFDQNGCSSISLQYDVTSINGNGGVGINENALHFIQLYPNPVSVALTISIEDEIKQVRIYDFSGKLVFELRNNQASQLQIDVSNWENGMYIVSAINETGISQSKRFIVSK